MGPTAFVHRATGVNVSGNSTYLEHPMLDRQPSAWLLATPVWNPGGAGGVYNNHAIGAWYDSGRERWAIFNQDGAAMTVGAAFNIRTAAT